MYDITMYYILIQHSSQNFHNPYGKLQLKPKRTNQWKKLKYKKVQDFRPRTS